MQRTVLFILSSLLVGISSAFATPEVPLVPGDDHHEDHHERRREQRLACQFINGGVGVVGVPGLGKKGGGAAVAGGIHSCVALARTCGNFDDRDGEDDLRISSNEDRRDNRRDDDHCRFDRLAVACDGLPVYADGAIRARLDGIELLTSVLGPANLSLRYVRFGDRHHDDRRDDRRNATRNDDHERDRGDDRVFNTPAALALNGVVMEGFCAVEREDRDNNHDHHDFK